TLTLSTRVGVAPRAVSLDSPWRSASIFWVRPTANTPPLSLHDALPIFRPLGGRRAAGYRAREGAGGRHDGDHGHADVSHACCRRSEEHTSELQSLTNLVCRLLLEKKKTRGCVESSSERGVSCARHGAVH